ncbi:MAG TPA: phage holin [Candidatus Ornithomonoglobus merdipullorum]|jgi:phi LC3 family holin|uniref:Phage holin n=1 Tax=Candidatus Ornithomonoglobus merdipullorum TaxID=2840895 RepID=A0A9D1SDJ8_9FIRM|nr:MAG TPA: holin [Caudoviricetes sp.]HIU56180.1 phage holin [Candidatus Ornithomonoglobus merdipullorum]
MNINWRVRIKNPAFWVSIAIAIVTPILAYFGLTAQDMTSWGAIWDVVVQAVSNPYVILTVAVSVYNAIVDPTSTGVTDSSRALQYDAPNSIKD